MWKFSSVPINYQARNICNFKVYHHACKVLLYSKHIYILNGSSSIWNKNQTSSMLADTSSLPLAYEIYLNQSYRKS